MHLLRLGWSCRAAEVRTVTWKGKDPRRGRRAIRGTDPHLRHTAGSTAHLHGRRFWFCICELMAIRRDRNERSPPRRRVHDERALVAGRGIEDPGLAQGRLGRRGGCVGHRHGQCQPSVVQKAGISETGTRKCWSELHSVRSPQPHCDPDPCVVSNRNLANIVDRVRMREEQTVNAAGD
jgi:hypothetical protein